MRTSDIFYITIELERAWGLKEVFPKMHIVSAKSNSLYKNQKNIFIGANKNTYELLKDHKTQEYINENSKRPKLIFFKPTKKLEILAESLGFEVLNPSSQLNRKLEDKHRNYLNLRDNSKVPQPKSAIVNFDEDYVQKIIKEFSKAVIQKNFGHTGNSTYIIDSSKESFNEDLGALKINLGSRRVKISEFIQGDTFTLNAVVDREGNTYFGGLSKQITGVSELTKLKGATIGNDWNAGHELEQATLKQIELMVVEVGKYLHVHDFFGMFGIDLMVSHKTKQAYFIEINARQPLSASYHNQLSHKNNFKGLLTKHLEVLAQQEFEEAKSLEVNNDLNDISGVQIFTRNLYSKQLSKISNSYSKELPNGIILLEQDCESLPFNEEIRRLQSTKFELEKLVNLAKEIASEDEYSTVPNPSRS